MPFFVLLLYISGLPPFLSHPPALEQRILLPLFSSCQSLQMFGALSVSAGNNLSTVRLSKSRCPTNTTGGRRRSIVVSAVAGTIGAPRTANLYQILQVKETASLVEIKTAYRSLAKRFHPDATSHGSDGRDFIQIHDAYATLSDPMARAQYDLSIGRSSFPRDSHHRYGARSNWNDMRFQPRRWETDQCW
ncbi:uncharacterized protein [Aristolochia californica]|uniref:uncharacterized protein n=1 Tax=Aristolochia californica TaxID=171875 RepID=UPI0035E33D4D